MKLSIRRPDDFHVHLREREMLQLVAPLTAKHFARALVMPNLWQPVVTGFDVSRYRDAIQKAADNPSFTPLMTIKLLDGLTPETILTARAAGAIAAKLYPRGVTTNSDDGVSDPLALGTVYETMEACGMVLCLHGETPGVFCMEREAAFLDTLGEIVVRHPKLKIVLEHVTTAQAVSFVMLAPENVAATITVHHLVLTLDDVVGEKIKPHHFCKPIAKTPHDLRILRRAATSGSPKFFLGTDSAPHSLAHKECSAGCAGVFTAPVALPVLAEVFEQEEALDKLEAFTSEFGARFYGLPLNDGTIWITKEPWKVPWYHVPFEDRQMRDNPRSWLRPLFVGRELSWKVPY